MGVLCNFLPSRILDYSCSTYFFCKRQIKRKDLMIDSVGFVFGRGLVGNILKKMIAGTNLFHIYTNEQLRFNSSDFIMTFAIKCCSLYLA